MSALHRPTWCAVHLPSVVIHQERRKGLQSCLYLSCRVFLGCACSACTFCKPWPTSMALIKYRFEVYGKGALRRPCLPTGILRKRSSIWLEKGSAQWKATCALQLYQPVCSLAKLPDLNVSSVDSVGHRSCAQSKEFSFGTRQYRKQTGFVSGAL